MATKNENEGRTSQYFLHPAPAPIDIKIMKLIFLYQNYKLFSESNLPKHCTL